jgi:hypothetical protein
MSHDDMRVSSKKAATALKQLHVHPSREEKRAHHLQYYSLSELVSDLWWLNKTAVDRKLFKGSLPVYDRERETRH